MGIFTNNKWIIFTKDLTKENSHKWFNKGGFLQMLWQRETFTKDLTKGKFYKGFNKGKIYKGFDKGGFYKVFNKGAIFFYKGFNKGGFYKWFNKGKFFTKGLTNGIFLQRI